MTSSLIRIAILLPLLTEALAERSCENGEQCVEKETSSLLMLRHKEEGAYKPRDIRGKSLYFIVTDYFADPPKGQPYSTCDAPGWCNGTIRGITQHLDYIQGMGFEGIWITPAVLQFYGPDPDGRSGYGNYGYWAKDWYEIDPNFGTEEELKQLSHELHRRDMVFVYDIVLNHVGPVHSAQAIESFRPFNKPEYLHQLARGNLTFDEYVKGFAYGGIGYPPPVQALGPGAMCDSELASCNNYWCPVDPGFGMPCPVPEKYLGPKAAGPPSIPFCGVGDESCAGYNVEQTIEGWFYDLGDLNHSHPFVSSELIKWGKYMKKKYHIDGFRLDTAPYVRKDFLSKFQAEVEIPILGEVTASNWSFFKSYAPTEGEPPVLKGLLNFYLQNMATPGFCGLPFFPGANLNLTRLGESMRVEYEDSTGGVNDLNLLGNFVDNHDMQRLAFYCKGSMSRIKNAITWTMLTQGIPIIFYGTEHFFNVTHPPMWNAGFSTTTQGYALMQNLNNIRKTFKLHLAAMTVVRASENQLVFRRQSDKTVFVLLNNYADGTSHVEYGVDFLPKSPDGWVWADALHGYAVPDISDSEGVLRTSTTDPLVLTLVERISLAQLQDARAEVLAERL